MSDKCIKIAKSQKYNFRQKISCKMSNWMSAFFFSAVVLNAGVTAWSEQRKDTCGLKPFLITPNLHNYKTLWNVQPTQTNPARSLYRKGFGNLPPLRYQHLEVSNYWGNNSHYQQKRQKEQHSTRLAY